MKKKYWKKITKREVKDHADFLADLSHEEFLQELGLEKTESVVDGRSTTDWELKATPRVKGYHDTWCRSRIGRQLDQLKERTGFDILDARRHVLSGGSVFISEDTWNSIQNIITKYDPRHSRFITSGIKVSIFDSEPQMIELSMSQTNY